MTPTDEIEEPGCSLGPDDAFDDSDDLPIAEEIGEDEPDEEGDGLLPALDEPLPNKPVLQPADLDETGLLDDLADAYEDEQDGPTGVVGLLGRAKARRRVKPLSGPHIQARGFRANRDRDGGRGVRLVALHTAEGATDEVSLGKFFQGIDNASSNAGIGQDGGYASYVRYEHTSWTNSPVNDESDTLEICGFAGWTRETWLRHTKMLDTIAHWIAWRCQARGIPLERIEGSRLRTGKGVTDHRRINDVYRESSHWDIGPGFPWDVVMRKAAALLAVPPPPWRDAALYPERPRTTVTVRRNDTLAKIGSRYRCPVATIKRINNFKRGQRIHVGQQIIVADLRPVIEHAKIEAISEEYATRGVPGKGREVRIIEAALIAEGHLRKGDALNRWGRGNMKGWTAWQVACGEEPTGIVDRRSLRDLARKYAFKVV